MKMCLLLHTESTVSTSALYKNRKAAVSSPPGEYEFVKVVVAPGQEAFLHDVRLDAHCVALTLNVHFYTVQQVFNRRDGLPGSECYHRFLIRLQAVDGVVVET